MSDAPADSGHSLADQLRDPRARQWLTGLVLLFLVVLAWQLRQLFVIEGVLDVDAIYFGLAAFRFDLLDHQPHPPGYPGYVVLLKLVHGVAPGLDPVAVATVTCRLTGVATVVAAWWAARALLRLAPSGSSDPAPLWRPLAAALLAAVHPLLWYYGADGQSHGAEALGTLLLLGAAAGVKRHPTLVRCALFAAGLGLAGSLRPTLALLNAPLLVWLLWRRPWQTWVTAVAAGGVAVIAWFVPLVLASGGWALYQRASGVLVGDIFLSYYSVFSQRSTPGAVLVHADRWLVGVAFAVPPLLAWAWRTGAPRPPWRRVYWILVAAPLLFYAVTFVGEPGYFTPVAALSCLVPVSWPVRPPGWLRVRAAAVAVGLPLITLLGPEHVSAPLSGTEQWLPTLDRAVAAEGFHRHYRAVLCPHARPGGVLVLSDNLNLTANRLLPLRCPGAVVAVHVYRPPFNVELDVWQIFHPRSMQSVPTSVPLEPGPAARVTVAAPVARVAVSPDATRALAQWALKRATCAPVAGRSGPQRWPRGPLVWPARCLPTLHRGRHTLVLRRARTHPERTP